MNRQIYIKDAYYYERIFQHRRFLAFLRGSCLGVFCNTKTAAPEGADTEYSNDIIFEQNFYEFI